MSNIYMLTMKLLNYKKCCEKNKKRTTPHPTLPHSLRVSTSRLGEEWILGVEKFDVEIYEFRIEQTVTRIMSRIARRVIETSQIFFSSWQP